MRLNTYREMLHLLFVLLYFARQNQDNVKFEEYIRKKTINPLLKCSLIFNKIIKKINYSSFHLTLCQWGIH